MPENTATLTIYDYIEIALRHKFLIIIPILIILPLSIALSYVLPKAYKAQTTILVIPQNVPDHFIESTVTMNPSEYLNVISQEILSRTHLEKVIQRISPELLDKLPIDNLISTMRKNIDVEVEQRRNKGVASFSITYIDKDPYIAAEATNLMATLFIEENLKSRENQAKKTTSFLANELNQLKTILEGQESIISEFKQNNLGSLPEQRDSNLRMLDQLIIQRQRITDEINDTENRKLLLQQQLLQPDNFFPLSGEEDALPSGSIQARINVAKRKLTALLNKYTAEHPDVITAQIELEKLLTQTNSAHSNNQSESLAPVTSEIDQQLFALDLKIKTLKNEDAAIKSKIANYQSRVERAPELEQQLFSITRNYENTKNAYDVLLIKRREAEQAEKLEMNQQGEQFKVLDAAKVPKKPFKPDKTKIILMGILLALAVGGGFVFLVEFFDQSFHNVKDLEAYLGLPVIVSIPLVSEGQQGKPLYK